MQKVIFENTKVPIKLWLDDIESGALEQAIHLANLPFAFKHVAIMPDAHQGYGMPIGGIIALEDIVIPNAVGVDIGCGMCAVKTPFLVLQKDTLKKIMGEIRKFVPVGYNHHKETQDPQRLPHTCHDIRERRDLFPVIDEQFDSLPYQLGTLGGGNHFIEFQKGSDGYIWIMVHSGSRNIGKRVCDHYNKIAKDLNKKWASSIPSEWRLAFLPMSSDEGRAYWNEMQWCVEFAVANRDLILNKVIEAMSAAGRHFDLFDDVTEDDYIDISHNYAAIENHFGKNVVIHRKGATRARKDELGIIPGSQGTKSYIVKGLGNPMSFESCSHGAGRAMSRTKARETLSLENEKAKLENQGIIHAIRGVKDLDEAAGAYKDIDIVMENQKDLVEIVVELTPLAVIKG